MIFFYLLVGSLPLTQHPLLTKFVGELTVIKVLGGICLFFALFRAATQRSFPPLFEKGPVRWSLFFFLIGVTSYFVRGSPLPFKSSGVAGLLSCVLLLVLTPIMVDTLPRLRWVLLTIIGSVAFASIYVVREWQTWHNVFPGFRGWGGVTDDPNYFTVTAVLWVPLAFYLARGSGPRWQKWFCMGCCVTTLLAITLAASRGGFLGLLAGLLFTVGRTEHRVRNFGLISLLVVPLIFVAPSSPLKRLTEPTKSDDEAADNRLVVWKGGLRMFQAHPLVGVGLDKFLFLVGQYEEDEPKLVWSLAHNTYLQIAAELGLVGFFPFLAIIFSTYRTLGLVLKRSLDSGPPLLAQAAVAMQAGLVAWMVSIFFISGLQRTFWLLVALAISLQCLQTQSSSQQSDLPVRQRA